MSTIQTPKQFTLYTLIAAVVAAVAAWASMALALEVWVMFAGFIAWFTRPTSVRESLNAMGCLWLGIALAAISHKMTGAMIPAFGTLALPVVVFIVAIIMVGLRTTPPVNNMLTWFLGMVVFFAADKGISIETFSHLLSATAIGGFAGWSCHTLNKRFTNA